MLELETHRPRIWTLGAEESLLGFVCRFAVATNVWPSQVGLAIGINQGPWTQLLYRRELARPLSRLTGVDVANLHWAQFQLSDGDRVLFRDTVIPRRSVNAVSRLTDTSNSNVHKASWLIDEPMATGKSEPAMTDRCLRGGRVFWTRLDPRCAASCKLSRSVGFNHSNENPAKDYVRPAQRACSG